MAAPKIKARRHEYFKQKYETLWTNFKDELSDVERIAMDLSFGISGKTLHNSEIAERLNLKNASYPSGIVKRALNKLRKAATKAAKAETENARIG